MTQPTKRHVPTDIELLQLATELGNDTAPPPWAQKRLQTIMFALLKQDGAKQHAQQVILNAMATAYTLGMHAERKQWDTDLQRPPRSAMVVKQVLGTP